MRVMPSTGISALFTLLLCSSVAVQAAPPSARWITFNVTNVGRDRWSDWHSEQPWPFRVRFKCEHDGSLTMNAVNTDMMHQQVTVHYWDAEATHDQLERAIQSRKALQNRGFVLPARQSVLRPLHRDVCTQESNNFAFGVVLGT
jgi:hypothetical protein